MKTKEQILKWLDKQPWKGEFYEEAFNCRELPISYDIQFICTAFCWAFAKSGTDVWVKRNADFRSWFDSNDKPMSWAEYCEQHPIKKSEKFISANCGILDMTERLRDADSDANVMSKDLCEAFLAYMKLIQLRNAWVEDGDENLCRIVWSPNKGFWWVRCAHNGLSFPTPEMADEFIKTFKDLLEVAKPLI